ncbi:type II secretion system F family protein [Nonomuraea endophytica]|uniref:type II secretion system F family protein n=1 Tax=Nonomuraea endophytica TaxID=714136 RepID=UPI0037C94860
MALSLLLGAGIGLGLVLVAFGLWPARPSLAQELVRLRHGDPAKAPADPDAVARLGRRLAVRTPVSEAMRRDLAVCDKSVERYFGEKLGAALVFSLLGPGFYGLLALGDLWLPWQIPVWCMLLLGVAGFFMPDTAIRAEAAKRRAEFRHTLSAFLDLVVVSLAGGRGVDGALTDAAAGGSGWAFVRLRATLLAATSARRTPWSALGQMGEEYGISELRELASSVALAGTEGARVRASLVAKATSLRAHQLAEIETAARASTERMSVMTVGLFVGFLLFVGYPAVAAVLTGF